MSRKKLCLFLLLYGSSIAFAQTDFDFGRTYSDTLPEHFKLNTTNVRNHIYQGIPQDIKEQQHPRSAFKFADQSAIGLSSLFASGQVYSDWQALEDYLNELLEKVMPKELADEKFIHAYILKDGDFNAFMTPSGQTFINIGIFDEIDNEATLAGILAHELAHYYLRHSLKSFVKEEKGAFKPGLFLKNKDAANHFSIANELEADSLAMVWIQQSGYHINGLIEGFKIAERIDHNKLKRQEHVWEVEETTHPRSEKRVAILEAFAKENTATEGQYFLISEKKFLEFQEKAKPEILKHLINNFYYSNCGEKAFKFHIYDPTNSVYVYYLMEAIRRNCYVNNHLWEKNFIMNRYYEEIIERGEKRKVKTKAHLFEELPMDILCLNPDKVADIKSKFYWQDIKFTTYEEAFLFFSQVGEMLKQPECILSLALGVSHDEANRNKLLEKYLTYENIRYKDFANALLKNEVKSSLKNNKLTVIDGFYAIVRHAKEEILIREETSDNNAQLNTFFEKIESVNKRKYVYLQDLKNQQQNNYVTLQELGQFSFMTIYASGQKTELHILEPRYWETMKELGVNEVEFINCSYYDNRKYDNSLEGYQAIVQTDFDALLTEVKRHRYVDVFVTSVRMIDKGIMKIRYHSGEQKLAFKKAGHDQILEQIAFSLREKDKKASALDEKYKNY